MAVTARKPVMDGKYAKGHKMDERMLDMIAEVFTDILHSYKEVITNRYIEEMTSGDGRIVDSLGMVELIEVDSIETHFTERFKEQIEERIVELEEERDGGY